MTKLFYAVTALCLFAASSVLASNTSWDNIKFQLYGERALHNGDHVIAIDAPYRTPDDARANIAAHVVAPKGQNISRVTLVLDDNPMPVSAVFSLYDPRPSFFFDVTMRVNGPTPMHVVAETSDGQLFVSETFVKTSGLGACSAPPGSDPEAALASLGKMEVGITGRIAMSDATDLFNRLNRMDVDIQHPSHSGMQMDQISLLFIPMRYIDQVDIDLDGQAYVGMEGSISLSENPRVGLSVPARSQSVNVTIKDTDGTVSHTHKKLAGY